MKRECIKIFFNNGSIVFAQIASSFVERLRGLLFSPEPQLNLGLWIEPCWAIHTFGMNFPIDILFLSKDLRVCKVEHSVPPNRIKFCLKSYFVIELKAGTVSLLGSIDRIVSMRTMK